MQRVSRVAFPCLVASVEYLKPALTRPQRRHLRRRKIKKRSRCELRDMEDLLLSSIRSNEFSCIAENAPPAEICARIESFVKDFLRRLVSSEPSISSLPLVSRTTKNARIQEDCFGKGSSIFLMHATFERKFTTRGGVKIFLRVWMLLEICYRLLISGKRATQREIYYRLVGDPSCCVETPQQVNDAIQDAVALLKCSRHSLGIYASGKGLLVGRLVIQGPDGRRIDCTKLGPNHFPISGDINYIERLEFLSDARYIFVVEKETVFQRLARDRFYHSVPCIIITGKGYPDLATRVILHRIHRTFPTLSIFALVDWNPSGLAILCTYKFGSIRMGLETPHHVCDVKWLGLRHEDLQYISSEAMLDLKGRDKVLAKSLLVSKMLQNNEKLKNELIQMIQNGKRVEIEALHANGERFLGNFIAEKVVQHDYI
ncbi:meiotic recombination protein SPO11 [Marchantia polymorpha subsp. ruderalis]